MDNLDKKVKLAFLPSYNRVRLRLSISGDNNENIKNIIDYHVKKLYGIIPQYIFGEDQTTIEESISRILIKKKLTISLAESCTGGYLSHLFTKISGCSNVVCCKSTKLYILKDVTVTKINMKETYHKNSVFVNSFLKLPMIAE